MDIFKTQRIRQMRTQIWRMRRTWWTWWIHQTRWIWRIWRTWRIQRIRRTQRIWRIRRSPSLFLKRGLLLLLLLRAFSPLTERLTVKISI